MYAKAQVIGNLGRDPETRYTQSGMMNVSFSIASSRRWTDRNGQPQEKTTWFRVTAWGKQAETMDKMVQDGYLMKGKQIFVTGRIELNEYTGNDGQQRASIEISLDDFQLLGSRQDSGGGTSSGGGSAGRSSEPAGDASDAGDLNDVPF